MKMQSRVSKLLSLMIMVFVLVSGAAYGETALDSDQYTMHDLRLMSYDDMIRTVSQIEWNDIEDLFKYNQDAYDFYIDKDRMQALLSAIESKAATYDGTNPQEIETLIEVVRAGYYLGFYNEPLNYLNTKEEKAKSEMAVKALQKSPYFNLNTNENAQVVAATGLLVNNTTCTPEIVNGFTKVLKEFNDNFTAYVDNDTNDEHRAKRSALYNVIDGVTHVITNETLRMNPQDTDWYGQIDGYIAQIDRLVIQDQVTEDNDWLINNGIYHTGKLSVYRNDPSLSNKTLTEAMAQYEKYGIQYLEAASLIEEAFDSMNYNGENIGFKSLIESAKKYYHPNTYVFDDGKMVIKSGAKVTEEKIKRLYWATSEVKSQFFRIYGTDQPRDENHADDVLTIVLYNSPAEYKANRVLYGLDTDNGGMYIERDGTFYTYERTPEESIYTLEELFRHEFTHYLQGRYVVPGYWGDTDLYKDGRLSWYEEGGAEFFAGSTRLDEILDRRAMVGKLRSDLSSRYTLSEILNTTQYSSDLYTFGYTFMSYMYHNRMDIFDRLADYVMDDDVAGYDAYIKQLSQDSALNQAYQDYMQSLYENYETYTTPLVSDDYLDTHSDKTLDQIKNDIQTVTGLSNIVVEDLKSDLMNAFTLKGTYTGAYYQGESRDRDKMQDIVDGYLETLSKSSWTGYKTLTAYFVNYRQDASNSMQYDVVFKGILTDEIANVLPEAIITAPINGVKGEPVEFSGLNSQDEDGFIVTYAWAFGDGNISTAASPSHTYAAEGNYTVSLTTTDNSGAESTVTADISITKFPAPITQEYEDNNAYDKANKGVYSGIGITGQISKDDNKDVFRIDALEAGTLDIKLNADSENGLNWLLYSADDLEHYAAYPNRTGTAYNGSYDALEGRYYLVVYSTGDTAVEYTFNVNGPIPTRLQQDEAEANDTFAQAQGPIVLEMPLMGTLDDNDYQDIFYFNVESACRLDISVQKDSDAGLNWLLFKAGNTSEFVAYPTSTGSSITGSYEAAPGKYYIKLYNYTDLDGLYELKVTPIYN